MVGILAGIFVLLVVLVVVAVLMRFFGLWLQAMMSGASVSFINLIAMTLRRVNPSTIVVTRITAIKAGLNLSTDDLEGHYLAGGNVARVVQAMIAAEKAAREDIRLSWAQACAIDLAGRDVLDAVKTSVNPRVIDSPDPSKGKSSIDAVAMDGIQLKAKARVTVRASLERLIGGATEETIVARVGEGIVSAIGSAENHKRVLENPDLISKAVLKKGLDSGTAFEILSIDIADVDVGENIGAKLQAEQAEADKQIAQAKAEERRAMAIAREQEMRASVEEMRARVVEAEAEVPRAMAEAFRSGNLGIMDYYRMQNIEADTGMRESLGDQSNDS